MQNLSTSLFSPLVSSAWPYAGDEPECRATDVPSSELGLSAFLNSTSTSSLSFPSSLLPSLPSSMLDRPVGESRLTESSAVTRSSLEILSKQLGLRDDLLQTAAQVTLSSLPAYPATVSIGAISKVNSNTETSSLNVMSVAGHTGNGPLFPPAQQVAFLRQSPACQPRTEENSHAENIFHLRPMTSLSLPMPLLTLPSTGLPIPLSSLTPSATHQFVPLATGPPTAWSPVALASAAAASAATATAAASTTVASSPAIGTTNSTLRLAVTDLSLS
ncbi:unnamed protein product, partial [Protopolystoma xenopodis]